MKSTQTHEITNKDDPPLPTKSTRPTKKDQQSKKERESQKERERGDTDRAG